MRKSTIPTCAVLFLTTAVTAGGPPANDDCSSAIPVVQDTVYNFDTTAATTDGLATTGCFFNNGEIVRDIWYQFTAPATDEYRVSLCGSSYDSRLAVYDTCNCGDAGTAPISCDDAFCDPGLQSQLDFDAVQGQCYLIRVGGYLSSGGTEYFGPGQMIITEAPPAPANDFCIDAIPIDVPSVTAGTTTDSTEDKEFTGCGTGFVSYVGVWYKVIGTGTSMRANTCNNTDFDTKITVFCGGCDMDICVNGNDNYNCTPPPPIEQQSRVSWCSTEGETYYILVHGGLGDFGDFELEVTALSTPCTFPQPCELPSNDDCANPLPVTDGETFFDNRLASTDGPEHKQCDVSSPPIYNDLWFTYTATCTGNATFSLCNSSFDTKMVIYDGTSCVDLENRVLSCSDDFDCSSGPDSWSQITMPVACGFEYLIRIGSDFLGDYDGGRLNITCAGEPCPDACPADLDDSTVVDLFDLLALLDNWGDCDSSCPPYCFGDIDRNCTVNLIDLLILIDAWGECE